MGKRLKFKLERIRPTINGLGDEVSHYALVQARELDGLTLEKAEEGAAEDLDAMVSGYEATGPSTSSEAERRSYLLRIARCAFILLAVDEHRRGSRMVEREESQYDAKGSFTKRSG